MGVVESHFFRFEPFPDLCAYSCQIWLRSYGCVKKKVGQMDRQTHRHAIAISAISDLLSTCVVGRPAGVAAENGVKM